MPILTEAQKKKKQVKEYQKQFIQQQRAKQDINAPKPQEIANPPPAIYPEIKNLQNNNNKNNQVDEPMHQRQTSSSNANTTEITSKKKRRSENQFIKSQLANQVKLVRQRLSEGPVGSLRTVYIIRNVNNTTYMCVVYQLVIYYNFKRCFVER
ncbi:Hypothetical_protein [Hexamita inflata]|uniref:Hypothetical_protein n=1 Tax=Hexamita inflata TaxID=28002 RepID=A0AA86N743_9EUKA|nr:Hypothetical protein HINF_LOCUS1760 [Hexamita inflata]